MVERLVDIEKVVGSIPTSSTISFYEQEKKKGKDNSINPKRDKTIFLDVIYQKFN